MRGGKGGPKSGSGDRPDGSGGRPSGDGGRRGPDSKDSDDSDDSDGSGSEVGESNTCQPFFEKYIDAQVRKGNGGGVLNHF